MAAATPSAIATYGDPLTMLPCQFAGQSPAQSTPAILRRGLHTYKHQVFYFDEIDDGDTWASGIRGIVNVAFARDAFISAEFADARLTSAPNGTISFTATGAGDASGFLHVWSNT